MKLVSMFFIFFTERKFKTLNLDMNSTGSQENPSKTKKSRPGRLTRAQSQSTKTTSDFPREGFPRVSSGSSKCQNMS